MLQFVHASAPMLGLNFPATHIGQGPPSGPVKPSLHLQSVINFCPVARVTLPDGHVRHVAGDFAPLDDEYVCNPHLVQSKVPTTCL